MSVLLTSHTGKVYGFGKNRCGELGVGDKDSRSELVEIDCPAFTLIANGVYHSIGVSSGGTVWGCGSNSSGQIGNSFEEDGTLKMELMCGINDVLYASAGSGFTIFLNSLGTVSILGRMSAHARKHSIPRVFNELKNIRRISAGMLHALVSDNDGKVYSLGYNKYGQLGRFGSSHYNEFVIILGLSEIKDVSCGFNHSVCISYCGDIHSFGDNRYGQLGIGVFGKNIQHNNTGIFVVKIDAIIVKIYCKADYSIFVDNGGNVWMCGSKLGDQISFGSSNVSHTPGICSKLKNTKLVPFWYGLVIIDQEGATRVYGNWGGQPYCCSTAIDDLSFGAPITKIKSAVTFL